MAFAIHRDTEQRRRLKWIHVLYNSITRYQMSGITGALQRMALCTCFLVPHHPQEPAPLLGAAKATATSAPPPTGLSSNSHDAAAATAGRLRAALESADAAADCAVSLLAPAPAPAFAAHALLWAAASANSAAKHRCRPRFACEGYRLHQTVMP